METGAPEQWKTLIVDDDAFIGRLVQLRLQTSGFVSDIVVNGEAALAKLSENEYDLIFLDVFLPDIGGLDLLGRIRAIDHDIGIIVMTASSTARTAIDALRNGADDYLRKPFEPEEFAAVLKRTTDRVRLTRQNTQLRAQLDEKRRLLEADLARAAKVQRSLLPQTYPDLPAYEFSACCLPAREVGGDFYDWFESSPGVWNVMLVDVMGKGMPAALLMATIRAIFRTSALNRSPGAALAVVVGAIGDDLERLDSFATVFLAQLDVASGVVTYVDAGHGLAIARHQDGRIGTPTERGLPIGVLRDEVYTEGQFVLGIGDTLVIYSDGLLDARSDIDLMPEPLGAMLPATATLVELVDFLTALAPDTSNLPDDLTVVALRRNQ